MNKLCICIKSNIANKIKELVDEAMTREPKHGPLVHLHKIYDLSEEIMRELDKDCTCQGKSEIPNNPTITDSPQLECENIDDYRMKAICPDCLRKYGTKEDAVYYQAEKPQSPCEHPLDWTRVVIAGVQDNSFKNTELFCCAKCGLVTCKNPNYTVKRTFI